jgi:2'-5' RNA ligase
MIRLFVALELPERARAALAEFCAAAAEPEVWRAVAAENLHLTLAFLGARPEDDVAAIERVLGSAAGPAPRLALGPGLLLPPRRARVLCASIEDPDGTLAALQTRVSAGLEAAGIYTPEKRRSARTPPWRGCARGRGLPGSWTRRPRRSSSRARR